MKHWELRLQHTYMQHLDLLSQYPYKHTCNIRLKNMKHLEHTLQHAFLAQRVARRTNAVEAAATTDGSTPCGGGARRGGGGRGSRMYLAHVTALGGLGWLGYIYVEDRTIIALTGLELPKKARPVFLTPRPDRRPGLCGAAENGNSEPAWPGRKPRSTRPAQLARKTTLPSILAFLRFDLDMEK